MTDWRFPQPLTHRGKPPNSPICSGDLPDRFTRFLLVHVSCAGCVCARLCVWLTFVSQRPARCGEKIPVMPLFCLTVNSAAAINLFMHIAVSSTVRWNLAPLTAFTESSLFAQDAHWEPLDSFSREKKKAAERSYGIQQEWVPILIHLLLSNRARNEYRGHFQCLLIPCEYRCSLAFHQLSLEFFLKTRRGLEREREKVLSFSRRP